MSILREWEGDGNTVVGDVGGVFSGCKYMGGKRGSGIVSSADYVLEMSVVRGVRGVDGVCEMCLVRSGVGMQGLELVRGLGLGFTNPVGTGDCGAFGLRRCVLLLYVY